MDDRLRKEPLLVTGRQHSSEEVGFYDERVGQSGRVRRGIDSQVSRTASAFADAIENGIDAAKRVGKRGSDAAEEFMDDTILRIKRHPVETVVAAFAWDLRLEDS